MADEQKFPPTEGVSEETPEEEKPTEAEGEETAEGEEKPEEEAAPAEEGGEDAAAEPEAGVEAAEDGGEAKPEEEQEQEVEAEAAVEEEVTATEAEVTEAPPAEEEEQAAEEPAQEESAAQEEEQVQEAEPEPEPEQEQEQEQAQEEEPEQEEQEEPEPEQEQEAEPEPEPEPLELTDEETETFTALFDMYSAEDSSDGVRKISKSGIKLLFRFMGEIVTDAIVCQWLEESDRNVDGMLNLEEFCSLYKKKRQPEDKRKEELLMSVNTLFPMNGEDDSISLEKVSNVLRHMNTQPGLVSENSVLTEDDINSVIAKIDTDGSHSISRQEFVDFLCGGRD